VIEVPTPDEIQRGALPWDTPVKSVREISMEAARLTFGEICDDYSGGRRLERALMFAFMEARKFDGTVEDVWLILKAAEERIRTLRLSRMRERES
jgi:hypothetical protein